MLDEEKTKEQLILELKELRRRMSTGVKNDTKDLPESPAGRKPEVSAAGLRIFHISREDLEFIIEATGLGLWWCDLPDGELRWNGQVKEHFWLKPEDNIDIDRFYAILHAEDREPCRQAIGKAVAERSLFDFTFRTVSSDGRIKWIQAVGQACYDADKPLRFLGITQDITAQKILEEELHQSEERFRAFMDNSPTTAWMKDEQGRYLYLSASAEKSFGVSREDWYGKSDLELFPPEKARLFSESDMTVLKTGRDVDVVEETMNPDGSRYAWWKFKFPFKDTAGNKYVGGIGLNITENKLMEEELRRRENILLTVLRAAPSGIGLTRDGNFIWMNEQMSNLTGYPCEELAGKSLSLLCASEQESESLKAAFPELSGEVGTIETRWKKKDGTVIDVLLSTAAVNASDPGEGHVFTATNISDRKNADQPKQKTV